MQRERAAGGFTLVEMLVVIALVALLIAMLLPSLQSARAMARQATCLAHVRMCNTAVLAYAADFKGWGPPHPGEAASASLGRTFPRWYNGSNWPAYNVAFPSITPEGPTYSGADPYLGYTPQTPMASRVYYRTKGCPTFPDELPAAWDVAYVANQRLLDPWRTVPYTRWYNLLSAIRQPSRMILMVECWRESIGPGIRPSILGDTLRVKGVLNRPRHEARGLNFAHVDGHARFYRYQIVEPLDATLDIITPEPMFSNQ